MKKSRRALLWAAGLYAAVMLILLMYRPSDWGTMPLSQLLEFHINLRPLRTIQLFIDCLKPPLRPNLVRRAIINLFGNVLMFVPLGFFPPLLSEKLRSFGKTVLLSAGIMSVIELLQLALMVGTCDVDDVLLNVTGAAIGYGFYRIITGIKKALNR